MPYIDLPETEEPTFDFNVAFDSDLYLYFTGSLLSEAQTDLEVDFLVRNFKLNGHRMRILDLACGYGRHANRLACLGHDVIGVDNNEEFLAMAEREAATMGAVSASYVQDDMRSIRFENAFDHAILMFTAFGYFSDDGNRLVLQKVHQALDAGGLLCLDINNRDNLTKIMTPAFVGERESNMMVNQLKFDVMTGRLIIRRTYLKDGRRIDGTMSLRQYSFTEMRDMLHSIGFRIVSVYGDFTEESLSINSPRMILIARKLGR